MFGIQPEAPTAYPLDQLDFHLTCHGQPLYSPTRETGYDGDQQTDASEWRCRTCTIQVTLTVRREVPRSAEAGSPPNSGEQHEWLDEIRPAPGQADR